MVWQKGKVQFTEFFAIFLPSLVNWLVPALFMSFAVEKSVPKVSEEKVTMKYGAWTMLALFLLTIVTAVCFHNFLHLPPAAGMMFGLGYLGAFAHHVQRHEGRATAYPEILGARGSESESVFLLEALRQGREKFSKTIGNMPVPAFAIDSDHVITHWNRACEELTGRSAEEMIGSQDQWAPFYRKKRPVMADLVLSYLPEQAIETHYKGKHRRVAEVEEAVGAFDFFPDLGEEGKWISFTAAPLRDEDGRVMGALEVLQDFTEQRRAVKQFSLMSTIARAEWDTLMFFYGVILCVGGLAQFGYLASVSAYLYHDLGPTFANTLVGVLSAIVDNIPVMFAVLKMDPTMSHGQWLLVTLTAGTGGSMLAIGSAAGVALMGTARGRYTFVSHLKWTPAIALGYGASIFCHIIINSGLM
jgi:PAS domain S-box-containing protein